VFEPVADALKIGDTDFAGKKSHRRFQQKRKNAMP